MAIAAAASWRARSASALAGNHWSGSRLTYRHRACRMTQDHDDRPVTGPGPDGSGARMAALPRMRAACSNPAGVVAGCSVIDHSLAGRRGPGDIPAVERWNAGPACAGGFMRGGRRPCQQLPGCQVLADNDHVKLLHRSPRSGPGTGVTAPMAAAMVGLPVRG